MPETWAIFLSLTKLLGSDLPTPAQVKRGGADSEWPSSLTLLANRGNNCLKNKLSTNVKMYPFWNAETF